MSFDIHFQTCYFNRLTKNRNPYTGKLQSVAIPDTLTKAEMNAVKNLLRSHRTDGNGYYAVNLCDSGSAKVSVIEDETTNLWNGLLVYVDILTPELTKLLWDFCHFGNMAAIPVLNHQTDRVFVASEVQRQLAVKRWSSPMLIETPQTLHQVLCHFTHNHVNSIHTVPMAKSECTVSSSLTELLSTHCDTPYDPGQRVFIENVASILYDRHEHFWQWPNCVQYFYACYELNYQVLNGGWVQAACSVPELFPVAEKAFEQFNRPVPANLCRRAFSMLPFEVQSIIATGYMDRQRIEAELEVFNFGLLETLDSATTTDFYVDDRLHQLVQDHRSDFESVDRFKIDIH